MPGNNGEGGVRGRSQLRPPTPAASAPSLLAPWPLALAGSEGTRGSGLAPRPLTRGLALHAPAAAQPLTPRAAPAAPPLRTILPGTAPNIPRAAPPSIALYGSFKAAAAT